MRKLVALAAVALLAAPGAARAGRDSDGDGMPDRWERRHGLDAQRANARGNPDCDSLRNLQEYRRGTHPKVRDSDGDSIPDGSAIAQEDDDDPDRCRWKFLDADSNRIDDEDDDDFEGQGLHGRALAGPTCPVESVPPDPECNPRPVAGAEMTVEQDGEAVASTTTATDGTFALELEPGDYTLVSGEVEGLLGTPEPVDFTVTEDETVVIVVDYDTGIR